ncbi:MAG: hypothetical protein AAFX87_04730 [Bacteroidota bacterium]
MREFIENLYNRNELLFWFGAANLLFAIILIVVSRFSSLEVMGVNAWYKPIKFALSTCIFSWAMGWYIHYLGTGAGMKAYSWGVVILLGFEVIYIAIQAGRGMLSHYNVSTPFYGLMFNLMALAATAITLWTAYIGLLFFAKQFPDLPNAYLWGIRLGILLFVVFSFEGFVMGARMSHTVGGPDGGTGLPFLNWSRKYGDPRIAHFIGMHALQVLPLAAFYLLRNVKLIFAFALIYGLLAVYVLLQALNGKPFIKY